MDSELFARRTSVRKYTSQEVPPALVDTLLEAAIQAPSSSNCQPWHFYVLRDREKIQQMSEGAFSQKVVTSAPVVIVVCVEPGRAVDRNGERGGTLYCLQDTAAAIENLLLCATQNGLGCCWCGDFEEERVSRVLGIPVSRRPVAMLPVGWPDGEARRPRRRPLAEVATYIG